MKAKESELPGGSSPPPPSPSQGFFQRTSAALHPRAIFRLSNMSAFSRESRMWGVKPKQDHEVENQTKEGLGELMSNDPNVKKMGEATGTTIRRAEEFPPDEDVIKANEARLAKWENKAKKRKWKKIFIFLGAMLIVGAVAAGTAVAVGSGNADEDDTGNKASPTLSPSFSPTSSPTLSPTLSPLRLTTEEDQKTLCEAIKESNDFEFASNENVFVSCQDDEGKSIFTCRGDGNVVDATDFCDLNGGRVCTCDPGQIVNAANFDGNFTRICLKESDPENQLCVELEGDLAGLFAEAQDGVSGLDAISENP